MLGYVSVKQLYAIKISWTVFSWKGWNLKMCVVSYSDGLSSNVGDTEICLECKNVLYSPQTSKWTFCHSVAQHYFFFLPFLLLWNAVCHLLPAARLASHGWLAVLSISSVIRKNQTHWLYHIPLNSYFETICSVHSHWMWPNFLHLFYIQHNLI